MVEENKNKKIGIIFPHQLFEQNLLFSTCDTIYLIEEWLYFKQYNFHKSKIAFHRASMKFYETYLTRVSGFQARTRPFCRSQLAPK